MNFILIVLLLILFATGVVVLLLNLLFRFLKRLTKTNPSRMAKDLAAMRLDMEKWLGELIPMNREELELLSFVQIKKNTSIINRSSDQSKGIFTSIYQEPLVAYSFKKYGRGAAILFAKTTSQTFEYQITDTETNIAVNGKHLGKLQGGLLRDGQSRLLARVNESREMPLRTVVINDRQVAHFSLHKQSPKPVPRLIEHLSPDLGSGEETTLLSLAILELVLQEVGV